MLVIAATIAAVLFMPFSNAVADNSGDIDIQNESVTADTGEYVDLDGYNIESGETVYWFNETSDSYEEVSSGTDYEMSYGDGSIQAVDGGAVSDGDELLVSYTYASTDEMTTTVMTLVPMFLALLILVFLARPIIDSVS